MEIVSKPYLLLSNVFQVCTLITGKSTFTCRQKVGRGLRLCVDQQGNRIEDRDINVLHVMANESFGEFVATLQKEIEDETGVKFGMLQLSLFVGKTYEEEKTVEKTITPQQATEIIQTLKDKGIINNNGHAEKNLTPKNIDLSTIPEAVKMEVIKAIEKAEPIAVDTLIGKTYTETTTEEKTITYDDAAQIMKQLEDEKLISKDGKIKDTMKAQLAAGTLDLGARFSQAQQKAIVRTIAKADRQLPIRDDSKEVTVRLKKQAFISPEFTALWDKIKQKTTYRVNIDIETLMKSCVKEMKEMPTIPKARLVSQTADIQIKSMGVSHTEREFHATDLSTNYEVLPDILRVISTETQLKRSTVGRIIRQSGRGDEFLDNPQAFLEKALEIIAKNRHSLAIDGIRYLKLANSEYYVQEIFDSSELIANLERNAVAVSNGLYDHIIYDSGVESRFAESIDKDPEVKLFFKIPKRFKIETPLGTYSPDWAVFLEHEGVEKLYFVLETKGTHDIFDLRTPERLKIHCGKQHFSALENDVEFSEVPVTNWREFKVKI